MNWRHRTTELLARFRIQATVSALYDVWGPAISRRDIRDMRNLSLLLKFWLHRTSNCIDIGANRGDILEQFVALAPAGTHFAFEPLPDLSRTLMGRFPQVNVRALALANRSGTSEFIRVVNMPSMSGFRPQWYPKPAVTESIAVEVSRLDDCLPADYVPSLIKIDVEGSEVDVIRGGMRTITTHKPIVVFEHFEGGAAAYGHGPRDIYNLLVREAEMEIRDIDGAGPYALADMEGAFSSRRVWTWVATPRRQ